MMQPAPPPAPRSSGIAGWLIGLLVTLFLLVFVIGVLAILAIFGVRRYIAASKTAEALNGVGSIARDAESGYATKSTLCKSASSPVPASMAAIAGRKYMSNPSEWTSDPADTGFTCLGYEMSWPQYYQYDYKQLSPDAFVALAHGDLDGDGVSSEFSENGRVLGGAVVLDTTVTQKNPEE